MADYSIPLDPDKLDDMEWLYQDFFDQAMNDQPITIYGDGEQTRTFTHVDDVTNAIIKLMDDKLAYGQMFNIGGIRRNFY